MKQKEQTKLINQLRENNRYLNERVLLLGKLYNRQEQITTLQAEIIKQQAAALRGEGILIDEKKISPLKVVK